MSTRIQLALQSGAVRCTSVQRIQVRGAGMKATQSRVENGRARTHALDGGSHAIYTTLCITLPCAALSVDCAGGL